MENATTRIKLTQNQYAIIDRGDFNLINKYKWFANKQSHTYYACSITSRKSGKRMLLRMHRLIMGAEPGQEIDHINGNGLDNRKENLRVATRKENQQNRHITWGNSTYKGVYWEKQKNKWRARIFVSGKCVHLGFFLTEKEAAVAYNQGAIKYFGSFACLNIIH